MDETFIAALERLPGWLLDPARGRLLVRWIFLRGLGLIYFSAFYSFAFQVRGLIGPDGILPAGDYLQAVARQLGSARIWYAPTLLWFSSSSRAIAALWIVGMIASVLVVLNIWPRGTLLVCFVCYLSFIGALQDFSAYQSDGMLLATGFLSLFYAPPGLWPRLGGKHPPSRANHFLLLWVWFAIYFESGTAKWLGGDPDWRHLTAMDQYYQNGPLPTWIGWYAQQMPHWFHMGCAAATLGMEAFVVWLMFFPRRWRIVCFWIVTPWQIGVILTANYTFLNYLVMLLGVLLLDDAFVARFLPRRKRPQFSAEPAGAQAEANPAAQATSSAPLGFGRAITFLRRGVEGFALAWIFYASTALMIWMFFPTLPLPMWPVEALEPFRVANQYGLFGRMTHGRYEIEFQGSSDGEHWTAFDFRYKPQELNEAPRIYAPYQPRFDWNLWFASLGSWRQNFFVLKTEARILEGSRAVASLFAGNPLANGPPRYVRSVVWQYWFTDLATKRKTGAWWRREVLGLYAPTLERQPDGTIHMVQIPGQGMFEPPE